MNVMITGAGGFLGTEILRQLSYEDNVHVVAFSSKSELSVAALLGGRLSVHSSDCIEDETLYKNADVLINCAFPRNASGAGMAQGMDYLSKVFRTAAAQKLALINISSQSVYDQHRCMPARENDSLCLGDAYAVAKYASELMLESYYGAPVVNAAYTNIRLASLIGIGFDQRVLNKLIKKALEGDTLTITDDGSAYGYMDVRDAACGIVTLAKSATDSWRHVYNLGVSQGISLTEMGKTVEAIMESDFSRSVEVVYEAKKCDRLPVCTTLDSTAFCNQFGWKKQFYLEDTARQIFSWESAKMLHGAMKKG